MQQIQVVRRKSIASEVKLSSWKICQLLQYKKVHNSEAMLLICYSRYPQSNGWTALLRRFISGVKRECTQYCPQAGEK
ncbi:MAG: hypothetical protein ACJA13_001539 [Paraglaciecola sp.]|jgi:hypothetical protein